MYGLGQPAKVKKQEQSYYYLTGILIATLSLKIQKIQLMQWRGRRQSSNVEDRRGMSGRGLAVGGGLGGIVILVL